MNKNLDLLRQLKLLSRPSWRPATAPLKDDDVVAAKYGGNPFLTMEAPRPRCKFCNTPEQLLLQLRLDQLPSSATGLAPKDPTLLQLFYCLNEESDCYSQTYANADLESFGLRIIKLDKPYDPGSDSTVAIAAKTIIGWASSQFDYPVYSKVEADFEYDEYLATSTLITDQGSRELLNFPGDKLFGCASWIQQPESFSCSVCKQEMEYFYQIASDENIPFMFGDGGIGYIFICFADLQAKFITQSG